MKRAALGLLGLLSGGCVATHALEFRGGATWIPAAKLSPDVDPEELGGDIQLRGEFEDGRGSGVRIAVETPRDKAAWENDEGGSPVFFGVHGTLARARFDEVTEGGSARLQVAGVGPVVGLRYGSDDVAVRGFIHAGGGVTSLRTSGSSANLNGRTDAAFVYGGGISLELFQHLSIEAMVSQWIMGYPSETVAEAGLIELGASLRF